MRPFFSFGSKAGRVVRPPLLGLEGTGWSPAGVVSPEDPDIAGGSEPLFIWYSGY